LEQQLQLLLGDRVGQDLVLLEIDGTLSLAGQKALDALLERLEAQLLRLKRRGHCRIAPTEAELAALTRRPEDPLLSRVATGLLERLEGTTEGEPAAAPQEGREEVIRRALMELHRTLTEVGARP
jgi:hypothetical protein